MNEIICVTENCYPISLFNDYIMITELLWLWESQQVFKATDWKIPVYDNLSPARWILSMDMQPFENHNFELWF